MGNEPIEVYERRRQTMKAIRTWSSLKKVVEAVELFGEYQPVVYIERRGALYRWSFAKGGGPYPLKMMICGYLGIPTRNVLIGFRTVGDAYAILSNRPEQGDTSDSWAIFETKSPITREMIKETLAKPHAAVMPPISKEERQELMGATKVSPQPWWRRLIERLR